MFKSVLVSIAKTNNLSRIFSVQCISGSGMHHFHTFFCSSNVTMMNIAQNL